MQKTSSFYKYLFVALFALFVDFVALIICKEVLGLHYLIATCTGFILGLLVNFILTNQYVFKSPKNENKKVVFLYFAVIGIIGLGILNIIMWVVVSKFGTNYILAKLIAVIPVYLWSYFAKATLYHDKH